MPTTAGAAAPTSPPGAPTEAALAAAAVSGFAAGLDARRLQRCAEGAALGPLGGRAGRGHLEDQVVQHLLPDVHAVLRQLATTPLAELQVSRGGARLYCWERPLDMLLALHQTCRRLPAEQLLRRSSVSTSAVC